MKKLSFFLVRDCGDYYSIVVEGDKEVAAEVLRSYYPEVRFVRTETVNQRRDKDFHGCRRFNGIIIRGCWFCYHLAPTAPKLEDEAA